MQVNLPHGMDPAFYALSLLRRRQLYKCIRITTHYLQQQEQKEQEGVVGSEENKEVGYINSHNEHVNNKTNKVNKSTESKLHHNANTIKATPTSTELSFAVEAQLWYVQKKAMIAQNYYQDVDIIDDNDDNNNNNLDEEQINQSSNNEKVKGTNTKQRPMSARYGYNRGNSESDVNTNTNNNNNINDEINSTSQNTNTSSVQRTTLSSRAGFRPMSSRLARVATASLLKVNDSCNKSLSKMDVTKLDLHKIGQCKPMLAKLLCEYLFYVEHKPKLTCELCQAALQLDLLDSHFTNTISNDNKEKNEMENVNTTRRVSLKHSSVEQEAKLPPLLPSTSAPSNKPEHEINHMNNNINVMYEEQVGITQKDDWWWKTKLAMSYYQLGLMRETQKWLNAALFEIPQAQLLYQQEQERIRLCKEAVKLKRDIRDRHKAETKVASTLTPLSSWNSGVNYHSSLILTLGSVLTKEELYLTALELYQAALTVNPVDHAIVLALARLYEMLHDNDKAYEFFEQVLRLHGNCAEALSCMAARCFYVHLQPELALEYYHRRLLKLGSWRQMAEVWNNIAITAYYAMNLDLALRAFSKALTLCTNDTLRAEVWYNIGCVALAMGDVHDGRGNVTINNSFARQAFKLSIYFNPGHVEGWNNLAVLMLNEEQDSEEVNKATSSLTSSTTISFEDILCGSLHDHDQDHWNETSKSIGELCLDMATKYEILPVEVYYNKALLCYERGELENAHKLLREALKIEPSHAESIILNNLILREFDAMENNN